MKLGLVNDKSPVRERYGFSRTTCGCPFCQAPCRHVPGSLDVGDLDRLRPPGADIFAWAEVHLRAVTDKAFPTLVPARGADGHCHWLRDGRCLVHDAAPYSCAFFDAHMTAKEAERRSAATIRARRKDAAENGLYFRVWQHLIRQSLTAPAGDRKGLLAEVNHLRRVLGTGFIPNPYPDRSPLQ